MEEFLAYLAGLVIVAMCFVAGLWAFGILWEQQLQSMARGWAY